MNNPGYNPYPASYQSPLYQQFQPQAMSMPLIRADMVEVDDMAAIERYPVGIGNDQLFVLRDRSKIIVKSAGQNGVSYTTYNREAPQQEAPPYVTWDKFNELLSRLGEKEDA